MRKHRQIGVLLAICLWLGCCTMAKAQHYVSIDGTVASHRVLHQLGQDSVYLVSNAVVVVSGGTLEMQPGVEVLFEPSAFLRVDGGSLLMEGDPINPVCLRPFELAHDWSGVQLKNISDTIVTNMSYVYFFGALTAVTATNCRGVNIVHCGFFNNFAGEGIDLIDCDAVVVSDCMFSQCVNGVKLKSKTRDCVDNVFSHNVFDKGQVNLTLSNTSFGFKCRDNIVSDNCFQNAVTALYFERIAGVMANCGKNFVLNNVISSRLPEGSVGYSSYGIRAGMDSLVVRNNVFWHNDEAINLINNCHLVVSDNSFHQNGCVLTNHFPNSSTCFTRNVFSATDSLIMEFPSAENRVNLNNIMNHRDDAVLFANRCSGAIDMQRDFWQCTSPEMIAMHVYDNADDPVLGTIRYEPFLAECDTVAPMSPPAMVKKQYVNGSWRISWDANPEADFSHYVLYYGDFDQYKFKFHVDSITGNSYVLPSHFAENVAVAACDRACDFDAFAPKGRSAYAFAAYYPYAGEDAVLCAPTAGFVINDASIPYSYNHFVWRTSGSGSFSDPLSLRTTYYPSDEDFETGVVTLTLRVVSGDEVKTSSLVLRLLDQLIVDAGPDYYSDLEHPIPLEQAAASHYDSLLWSSCGDGHFVDPRELHALYYPGEREREQRWVKLALHAWSYCGQLTDTVVYTLYDEFSLEGRTWFRDELRPNTQVLAVAQGDAYDFAPGFFRTVSDENGKFSFGSLLPDSYVLYAFPDTVDFDAAGSYYLGDLQWNESNMIELAGDVYDVDIVLPERLPIALGTGQISGLFDFPKAVFKAADFYCRPWLRADSAEYCTEGLSNVSIVLLNSSRQRILGFTLTDSRGGFSFNQLPFGTYFLMADLPRYGRGVCTPVTLSADHPVVSGLHLFVNGKGSVSLAHQTDFSEEQPISLYPNPAVDEVTVCGLSVDECYKVFVLNCLGDVVKAEQKRPRADGSLVVQVTSLSSGVYFLQIEGTDSRIGTKFVK